MPDSKSTDSPAAPGPVNPKRRSIRKPAMASVAPADDASAPPARSTRPPRRPVPSTPKSPPLVETAGPEPDAPLAQVHLAIGSIGGAHGLDGEIRVRLSTDDPAHLHRIKRVYIGDEPAPRR